MAQYFKGDETELKYFNSADPIATALEVQHDEFFDECYSCFVLGELIWDNKFSPLANAIQRDIFRESFFTLYDSFVTAGSAEAYLSVFRQIFGDDVEVTFTVPAPGKLNIDIVAATVELYEFIVRNISGNQYFFDTIVDEEDDIIVFQSIKGIESQYDLEQMLFEMVPAGIWTNITLTIERD